MEVNVGQANLNEILVTDRMRQEYGDLETLGDSISELGQIQTLAVKEVSGDANGTDYRYELLAGGRRFAAMAMAFGQEHVVNLTIYPADLQNHHQLAIELTENLQRKDMTPQEEVLGRKRVHEALSKIRTLEREAGDYGADEWTHQDTADALGVDRSGVTQDLQLADAMEKIPEAFEGVKTKREAENLLAIMMEQLINDELAERAAVEIAEETLSDRKQRLIESYHEGDFFEWAKAQSDGVYDIVEFDPDYGIKFGFSHSASTSKAIQAALIGDYQFVSTDVGVYRDYLRRALSECFRLAKEDAWLILWFAQDPWGEIVFSELERAGWSGKRIPAVWDKGMDGRTSAAPDIYLGRVHECFYYARKGAAVINQRARGDVLRYSPPKKRIHPTEKPTDLIKDIYERFGFPGSRVLIPHLGSGNGILAADSLSMRAEGCELNKDVRSAYIARVMELEEEADNE